MKTPESLESEGDKEEEKEEETTEGQGAVVNQSIADRLALQTLSEFFDAAATFVGVEGVNQRKLVTRDGLAEALTVMNSRQKLFQACPAIESMNQVEVPDQILGACPKPMDRDGLSRQELSEAVLVLRGDLSMNHFVVISQALQSLEKHINHELVHLNKHQRKMNRRFLKLRHRLRKVYHFDGAPRKMD